MKKVFSGHLGFFAYYYPPLGGAGSQRALSFARYLATLGWEVSVFTPREGVYGRDPSLEGGDFPGVHVTRTESWEPAVLLRKFQAGGKPGEPSSAGGDFVEEAQLGPLGNAVREWTRRTLYFPDSSRGWIRDAVAAALRRHRARPFDLLLSSSPPVSAHVAARRVARVARVPLVLDFRDLWAPTVTGESRKAVALLRGLLDSAAAVTTVSEGCARWVREFAPGTRVGVVYNGFEPEPGGAVDSASGDAAVERVPYIVHAGTTYPARQDARVLVAPLESLWERGRSLELRMAGRVDATTRERLGLLVAKGAVTFPGFLPKDEVGRLLSGARAILVWAWSGSDPIGRSQLPAKLFEALKIGKPVVLLAEPGSESEALGRTVGLEAVPPADTERLTGLLAGLAEGKVAPGLLPDPTACSRFRREVQAGLLDDFLRTVLEMERASPGTSVGKRLAFFAYYFPPLGGAGSQRALSFSRYLAGRGWQVTVFTPREGVYGRDASLLSDDLGGVRLERTGTWEPTVLLRRLRRGARQDDQGAGDFVNEVSLGAVGRTVRGLVRRAFYFPDSSRGWIGPVLARARRRHGERPFDAVLSSCPPVSAHLAAARFASEYRIPWIADWRDIWTARLESPPRLLARARELERELVQKADGLCAATDGVLDLLLRKREGSVPHATVRNGWVERDFPDGRTAPAPSPVILYTGTVYGRNQDLGGFLGALRRVRAGNAGAATKLRILGKIDAHTRNLVQRSGVEGIVEFEGFVTHERVVKELRAAAGLLLLGWKGDHEDADGIVPTKAYEYLAAGRPILALTQPDSELARIVGGCRGVTIAGFEEGKAMEDWIRAVAEGRAGEGPTRDEALPYRRAVQAAVLEGVIEEAVARGVAR